MNKTPTNELLQTFAPMWVWKEVIKQAQRSPQKRHKTGAVIFNKPRNPNLLSVGTAHPHNGGHKVASIHAEADAISRVHKNAPVYDAVCVVVTLTRDGHFAMSSRPCEGCAAQLKAKGLWRVVWCEKANDGSWAVNSESPEQLLEGTLIKTKYTEEMT